MATKQIQLSEQDLKDLRTLTDNRKDRPRGYATAFCIWNTRYGSKEEEIAERLCEKGVLIMSNEKNFRRHNQSFSYCLYSINENIQISDYEIEEPEQIA